MSKTDTPILIVNGKVDRLVPADQGARLFAAYAKACGTATYVEVPGLGHGPLPAYFDPDRNRGAAFRTVTDHCTVETRSAALTIDVSLAFLDKYLEP